MKFQRLVSHVMSFGVVLSSATMLHATQALASEERILVGSPDGTVQAEITAVSGALRYRILVDGKQVLAPSTLGIRSDDIEWGQDVRLGVARRHIVNERYAIFGAHSLAVNYASEAVIFATSHGLPYQIDLHVANDGVAIRLRLPAEIGRKIQADRTTWHLDGDPTLWTTAWDPGYEKPYTTTSLSKLGRDALGLPLTARVDQLYLTFTEATLKDYGDLGLQPGSGGVLQGELFNDPQGWSTNDAVVQPWRVTVVARNLTALVNTTLVQDLNAPPAPELARAKWIKPGRSSWQWLAIGDPHQEDQTQWVDWTKQLGFEYYLIDEGWSHWKDPWANLTEVVDYARKQHIKIWIWVHSKEVQAPVARKAYFERAKQAGVVGIKIDFPPPTNRWWSTWYWDTARDAAAVHLMVDFHGATKPTGMERTWPNALTREGVRGHEYQITRFKRRLDAAHDTILPFTRYVGGPGDYTPTVFEAKELQGNTWGHELAEAILFTSPYLCFGGHPRDYLANPAKDVVEAIPSVWDETRVLRGSEPGKVVAEARRSGNQWFIAVINGEDATSLQIPLDFLGKGAWRATEFFDAKNRPDAWDRKDSKATKDGHIQLDLSSRGGFVARMQRCAMTCD